LVVAPAQDQVRIGYRLGSIGLLFLLGLLVLLPQVGSGIYQDYLS